MTRYVSIRISAQTKSLLNSYKLHKGNNYDELIRKLALFEKVGLGLILTIEQKEELEKWRKYVR